MRYANMCPVFTAQRYASMLYAVIVCLPLCLPHSSIVSKLLNIESCKQSHMITQGLYSFLVPKFERDHL